eukprot:365379-Chlamydomonas_euryale.AAC.7
MSVLTRDKSCLLIYIVGTSGVHGGSHGRLVWAPGGMTAGLRRSSIPFRCASILGGCAAPSPWTRSLRTLPRYAAGQQVTLWHAARGNHAAPRAAAAAAAAASSSASARIVCCRARRDVQRVAALHRAAAAGGDG